MKKRSDSKLVLSLFFLLAECFCYFYVFACYKNKSLIKLKFYFSSVAQKIPPTYLNVEN